MSELNLDAYYYSFDSTGCVEVDAILAAVASAGSGCHHTEDWNEYNLTRDIQLAANKHAKEIATLKAERDEMIMAIAVFAREDLFCTDSNVEATYGKWVFEGKEDIKDLDIVKLMIYEAKSYE